MTNRMLIAAMALGLTAATAASAQGVDQRHWDQQHRINQGVRSGRLTPGEAHRVEQQHSIDRQEARMRDRNGGRLNGYGRAVLQHRETARAGISIAPSRMAAAGSEPTARS
jgi:hypothetical protein